MNQELETLRAELHSIVDLKIDKLIKPELKSGWYKNNNVPKWLMYFDLENDKRCGLDCDGVWYTDTKANDWISVEGNYLATPTEVQEALEKEAVKRGFKEGVKFITAYKNQTLQEYKVIDKFYYEDNIGGLKSCLCSGNGYIFCNGIWAEIVKPMSLEELCGNLDKMRLYQIQTYLTENKTQIIETLNNL